MSLIVNITSSILAAVVSVSGISTHVILPEKETNPVELSVSVTFSGDAYPVVKANQKLQDDISNLIQVNTSSLPKVNDTNKSITFYSPINGAYSENLYNFTGIKSVTQSLLDNGDRELKIETCPPAKLIAAISSYKADPTVAKVLLDYTKINILIEPKYASIVTLPNSQKLENNLYSIKANDVKNETLVFNVHKNKTYNSLLIIIIISFLIFGFVAFKIYNNYSSSKIIIK